MLSIALFCLIESSASLAKEPLVALFGDSVTAGVNSGFGGGIGGGAEDHGQLSIELDQELKSSARKSIVVNWGYGGTPTGPSQRTDGIVTSQHGINRIIPSLSGSKSTYSDVDCQTTPESCFVLIMYGTNDPDWAISSADTGFNTRLIVQRAKSQGFEPVVATLTPRTDFSVVSINSQISSAASAEGVSLVDQYTEFNAAGGLTLLDDEVHPSNEGYEVLAETWFNLFLKDAINANANTAAIINLLLDD